jgi:hypothetical protein
VRGRVNPAVAKGEPAPWMAACLQKRRFRGVRYGARLFAFFPQALRTAARPATNPWGCLERIWTLCKPENGTCGAAFSSWIKPLRRVHSANSRSEDAVASMIGGLFFFRPVK